MDRVLFAIRSRSDISVLDGILTRNLISHQIVNTPLVLGLSCGLSIITDETFLNDVRLCASRANLRINAIYRVISSAYESKYLKIQ
ncbi:MAG: putative Se/S carrier-like protein [Clostridia bacterium]